MDKPDGLSQTLSPYAPNFWNHIDEGIKPLVRAFVDKGYLPYSSCEGHSIFGRRFISLAFPTKEDARRLAYYLRMSNISLMSFEIKHVTDYYHDAFSYGERDLPKEIGWLNSIYYRGYQDYYFLEISLGKNSPPAFKNIPHILEKVIWRDSSTQQLIEFVKGEKYRDIVPVYNA